jgi:hypothetical protein
VAFMEDLVGDEEGKAGIGWRIRPRQPA